MGGQYMLLGPLDQNFNLFVFYTLLKLINYLIDIYII